MFDFNFSATGVLPIIGMPSSEPSVNSYSVQFFEIMDGGVTPDPPPPTKFTNIITPDLPTSPPIKFAAFIGPDLPTSPPPTKFAAIIGPDLPTSPPPTK